MMGYEDDELPGSHAAWLGLLHPDDRESSALALAPPSSASCPPLKSILSSRRRLPINS